MFKERGFHKLLALFCIFLVSGVGTIGSFNVTSSNILPSTHQSSSNTSTVIPTPYVVDGNVPRILSYKTMELRDQALTKIDPSKISHVYANMPLISTYALTPKEIPKAGLTHAAEDLKIYSISSYQNQNPQLSQDVSSGITLAETSQIVGVSKLHQMGLTGKGVKIAIVDSGVDPNLPAFQNATGSRVSTYFVRDEYKTQPENFHGTHVAGIAAGNGIYRVNGKLTQFDSEGMAPESEILSIQVLDSQGYGPISDVVKGIDMAITLKANIISLSLSSEFYNGTQLKDIQEIAVNSAVANGIIVVAAAGNLGPYGSGIGLPGGFENAIAVGATELTSDGYVVMWPFSAVGPQTDGYPGPDVVAPGADIVSVAIGTNDVSVSSGTSMATPHVSGGIALLKQAFPNATISEIREAITASANDIYAPIELQGRGLVNFTRAYEILSQTVFESKAVDAFPMTVTPRTIQDKNFVYRHQVVGSSKSLSFFIHSSRNITVVPKVDPDWNYGYAISVPNEIQLHSGLNEFAINSTINITSVSYISSRVYFEDKASGTILQNANITYFSLTKLSRSKILFDASKDRDTPVGYFGGHSPIGQFSLFGSYLESEGHTVETNFHQNITSSLLANYDVLVIGNPDLPYSQNEIDAIRQFVYIDGKSLLIIANGGLLTAESQVFETFNEPTLNAILDGSGIGFATNTAGTANNTIQLCSAGAGDVFSRIDECFTNAETSKSQDILPKLTKFPFFGPALAVKPGTSNHVEKVAFLDNKPVILSSDISGSHGRILLFSSALNFDNKGLKLGYDTTNNNEITSNHQIIRDSMDWLLAPRSISVKYSIDGKSKGEETTVVLHKNVEYTLHITNPNGDALNLNADQLTVQLLIPVYDSFGRFAKYSFVNIVASKVGDSYTFSYKFDDYGTYEFYILVTDPNGKLLSSDGHLEVLATLDLFNDQGKIYTLAFFMFFAIVVSWIVFLTNEGGRKRFLRKKKLT